MSYLAHDDGSMSLYQLAFDAGQSIELEEGRVIHVAIVDRRSRDEGKRIDRRRHQRMQSRRDRRCFVSADEGHMASFDLEHVFDNGLRHISG